MVKERCTSPNNVFTSLKPVFYGSFVLIACVFVLQVTEIATEDSREGVFRETVQTRVAKGNQSAIKSHDWSTTTLSRNASNRTALTFDAKFDHKQLQVQAREALKRMEERNAFVTNLTTRQSVLEKGFPMNWDSCSLRDAMDRKTNQSEPLHIVLVGGSCSARSADNCSVGSSPYGRFSDYLQKSFHNDNLDFKVTNMAQGGTSSVENGLFLDVIVDPDKTDVIIWEFALTDEWTLEDVNVRYFHSWVNRVNFLYAQAGRPRPPILLLILYEIYVGTPIKRNHILQNGLDTPLRGGLEIIKFYRRQGWNFQVVSLGSAIVNSAAVAHNPKLLVDDVHHPNCQSVKIISDMLLQAFYSSLSSCGNDDSNKNGLEASGGLEDTIHTPMNISVKSLLQEFSHPWQDLWSHILSPNVRVGSLTSWLPQLDNRTNLRIGNLDEIAKLSLHDTEKSDPSRQDRKLGYVLQKCATGRTDIVLLEPTLQWVGLGHKSIRKGLMAISINGVPVNREHSYYRMTKHVTTWVHVRNYVVEADKYVLSLCNNATRGRGMVFLRQLAGITSPSNGTSNSNITLR